MSAQWTDEDDLREQADNYRAARKDATAEQCWVDTAAQGQAEVDAALGGWVR